MAVVVLICGTGIISIRRQTLSDVNRVVCSLCSCYELLIGLLNGVTVCFRLRRSYAEGDGRAMSFKDVRLLYSYVDELREFTDLSMFSMCVVTSRYAACFFHKT